MISAVRVNPDDRSYLGKWIKKKKHFPDYFVGFIACKADVSKDKNGFFTCEDDGILAKFEGEWTSHIEFDGKCYWRQTEQVITPMVKQDFTLPSDSLYREDILLYKNGHEDFAQEAKVYLEEVQRHDAFLRESQRK
jgi:hypothetical protein